jgi:replicative DNA helicase
MPDKTDTTRRQFLTRSFARAIAKPAQTLRLPPCDMPAEQRLLGTCLAHPSAAKWAISVLKPEHFADYIHCDILEAIRNGLPPHKLKRLDEVGGPAYVTQLAMNRASPATIADDAASIIVTHRMRE